MTNLYSMLETNTDETVHLNKNIQAELKNYASDARAFVQYLGENNG